MRTAPVAAAALALGLLAGTTVGADAARLLTGKDIKNGSVTSKDVKNGTLTASDLRAGVIPESTDEGTYYTWHVSHDGSTTQRQWVSTQTVPARARVEGVSMSMSGDGWLACPAAWVDVTVQHGGPVAVAGISQDDVWFYGQKDALADKAGVLRFSGDCDNDNGALPAFEATVTFLVVERDPAGAVAFQ